MGRRASSRADGLIRDAFPPFSDERVNELVGAAIQQIDATSMLGGDAPRSESSGGSAEVDDEFRLFEIAPDASDDSTGGSSRRFSRHRWHYLAAAAIFIAIGVGVVGLLTHHSSPATRIPQISGRPVKPVPTTTCWNGSVVSAKAGCPAPPANDSPPVEPHGCVHSDTTGSNNVFINVLQAWSDPDGDNLSIASVANVSKNGVKTITHLHDGTPTIVYEADQPGIDFVFYTVSDGVNPPVQGTCELIISN